METPTTRTDRAAEASAEAERRYPESWDHYNDEPVDDWGYSECQREAFCAGVVWADANPKPHTITRAQCEDAMALLRPDIYGDVTGVEDMLESLGVKVLDTDTEA